MKNICVFCGSKEGRDPAYKESAVRLAREIVRLGCGLVYGGAKIGIMGILADSVLEAGGQVTGVMVDSLAEKEIAHRNLTTLYCVKTMHERKKKMYDLSDAFICFPGGLGTLDEFFEILTWKQIGLHDKPSAVLNLNGYFDPMLSMIRRGTDEGFIRVRSHPLIHIEDEPEKILSVIMPLIGRA